MNKYYEQPELKMLLLHSLDSMAADGMSGYDNELDWDNTVSGDNDIGFGDLD